MAKREKSLAEIIDSQITDVLKDYEPDLDSIVSDISSNLVWNGEFQRLLTNKVKAALNARKG